MLPDSGGRGMRKGWSGRGDESQSGDGWKPKKQVPKSDIEDEIIVGRLGISNGSEGERSRRVEDPGFEEAVMDDEGSKGRKV